MKIERAIIFSILCAYLILPPYTEINAPIVPPLDKDSIPNLAVFAIVVLILGKRTPLLEGAPLTKLLLALFIVSPFGTILTNLDPIYVGPVVVPGLPVRDAVAVIVKQGIFLLPFFLARQHLATEEAQREILLALAIAGVIYSIPMLLEIRLSPRVNIWVYGFFPHSFDQQIRFGGFRPVVFLGHGLVVAFFTLTTVIAAFGLWRAGLALFSFVGGYLTVLLVLCKTVGAWAYSLVALPLVLFTGRRTQIRVAALMACVVIGYPILRGTGLIPVEAMTEQAAAIQQERAESLSFRFENEEAVLAHAQQRPIFGWGGWGRNVVRDPVTGETGTVLDGRWLIVISVFGWCGYLVEFGLLGLPLILLARKAGRDPGATASPYVGPVALILAFNMFDLLPNSPLTPFTWLLAGAILGYTEKSATQSAAPTTKSKSEGRIETIL